MSILHPPLDEYLRAILELGEEGTEIIQARLAERLNISAPSVSEMVRRLGRDGFVEVLPDRRLRLTSSGQEYAERIVRRHRLAERLLIDILGLDWCLAHEEAERFEHVISDAVEDEAYRIKRKAKRSLDQVQDALEKGEQTVARVLKTGKTALDTLSAKLE